MSYKDVQYGVQKARIHNVFDANGADATYNEEAFGAHSNSSLPTDARAYDKFVNKDITANVIQGETVYGAVWG